jgi:hypothetical protein
MPRRQKVKKSEYPEYINNVLETVVEPTDYINKKGVSYSQFTIFSDCQYRWYLQYIKKHKSPPSIHFTFGTSMHETLQEYLQIMYDKSVAEANRWNHSEFFQRRFLELYREEKERIEGHFSSPSELMEFMEDGLAIIDYFIKNRGYYFTNGSQVLLGIEMPINITPTTNPNVFFNGKLDLVIYDHSLNKVKIIDIKTSTRGWNRYQKTDKTKLRQLPLYKKYFSEQYNVPLENIDVEYFIVKRKINEDAEFASQRKRIQTFIPPSGKITINQITAELNSFIQTCFDNNEYKTDIEYYKNTSKCKWCPFNDKPELCDKGASS